MTLRGAGDRTDELLRNKSNIFKKVEHNERGGDFKLAEG
jgi:hypothetical protein